VDKDMYEIFSKLLKERGETAYKVSKATGISQSTLSGWKRGISQPKADKLQKIADYFEVTLDYLLGNTDIKKAPSEDEAEITFNDFTYAMNEEAHELTEEEKEKLLELARFFNENRRKGKR
jgi:transcriptional regulator with XRE-family HTH domain